MGDSNFEYTAQAASAAVNGEVKLTIDEHSFTVSALFDTMQIPYAEVTGIIFADYTVIVKTDGGEFRFARMGEWAARFYNALCEAYGKAVLRSMFVSGKPLVTANGDYRYTEGGATGGTLGDVKAPIHVYDNCVTALPSDMGARRIPLCFVSSMNKGDYVLTLELDMGEQYVFSKLGYETAPAQAAIEKQIRALREKTLGIIKETDPALGSAQASQLAGLMPEGAAAPVGKIAQIAPGFADTLDKKLGELCNGEYFSVLKELCDFDKMYVGIRKQDSGSWKKSSGDDVLFWLIAPTPGGSHAIVEFFEEDTATFVYRTGGNFDMFARQLNRALEAISFKREVIRMTDEQLRVPEYADYYMAAKRTAALGFVRENFAERIIHSSAESWKRKLAAL